MTTLEIILVVFFTIVVSTIFFLYLINSVKIKNKLKKEKAQKEQEKLEQEKLEEQAKASQKPAENIEKESEKKPQIDVVDVEISNQTFDQTESTVAIVTEQKPEARTTLENMSREEFEAQMMETVEPVKQEKVTPQKSMKQQIDDLSPELKSMLFTDILKPKF